MKITCTRCLGKGYVDKKDINRFGKLTEWIDNSVCTFCLGKGTISEKFASKHNPDSEKFPNVEDYSELINFSNLSEEEKNKRFEEALERTGGDINFDEEDELTTKSQFKTIFWSSLVSILLTLTFVMYFVDYNRDAKQGEFEFFFSNILFLFLYFFVPAVIIYRLLFGKFSKWDLGDFILIFWGFTFMLSLNLFQSILERYLFIDGAFFLSIFLGLIFTIMLSKFIFLSKFEEQIKLCKDLIDKENLSNLKK